MSGQRSVYNASTAPRCTTSCAAGARSPTATTRTASCIGETYVLDADDLGAFYGDGTDELNLAFNFPLSALAARRTELRARSSSKPRPHLPADAWPVWTGSATTTTGRFTTRWCDGDDQPRSAPRS